MARGAIPQVEEEADPTWPGEAVAASPLDRELSAIRVLTAPQAVSALAVCAALVWALTAAPELTITALVAFSCGAATLAMAHSMLIAAVGVFIPARPLAAPSLDDGELPRYTVLCPMYKEAAVVGTLVSSLAALDYPPHLLDIQLIVEPDDLETNEALDEIRLGPQFEILRLPPGGPKTKPRACNIALSRARGELVVIFDAEDQPDPQQLRRAAATFSAAPRDVACLQATLHVWNPGTNSTSRYGAAEFAYVCNVVRPGLERLGAPILLCGTSCHFRVDLLRELGAWDEFNVAEDADLGIRLFRAGYQTRLFNTSTYEEANTELGNWTRQRSRWIKGWMQTWLVHNRHPLRLFRDLGLRHALHLHLTMIASTVVILVNPIVWAVPVLWMLRALGILHTFLPDWLLLFGTVSFVFALCLDMWTYALGLRRGGYHELGRSAIIVPLFGLLKTWPAIKALAQLIARPHYWEKTVHGLEAEQTLVVWPEPVRADSSA